MQKLTEAIDNVNKRQEHLDRKMTAEQKKAMEFSKAGKKREALQAIKRKKMYENQLDKLIKTLNALEMQKITFEGMGINKEILGAQQAAAQAMAATTAQMGGVDGVEEIMDSVQDGIDDANDIQDAFGREIAVPGCEDEDELLGELEGMMEEELAGELGTVNMGGSAASELPEAPISLPSAGTKKVMTEEERELAELEASMAAM